MMWNGITYFLKVNQLIVTQVWIQFSYALGSQIFVLVALYYIKDERFWFTILYFYLAENYIQSFGVFRITFYIFVAKFVNNMLMIDYLVLTDKRLTDLCKKNYFI